MTAGVLLALLTMAVPVLLKALAPIAEKNVQTGAAPPQTHDSAPDNAGNARSFDPFPKDMPLHQIPPVADGEGAGADERQVALEESLKNNPDYPAGYFLFLALTETLPSDWKPTGARMPVSVEELVLGGFLPVVPPAETQAAIDELLGLNGVLSGESPGASSGVPPEIMKNWDDWETASKIMYLKAATGSAVLNRISRGLFDSGITPGSPKGAPEKNPPRPGGLLALDAPGFSHRERFFKDNFGKRNDRFWTNPITGKPMTNESPDLPAGERLGNYWAELRPDGSVELRFYLK